MSVLSYNLTKLTKSQIYFKVFLLMHTFMLTYLIEFKKNHLFTLACLNNEQGTGDFLYVFISNIVAYETVSVQG